MNNIDVDSINDLAQHIRQVNGNNDMGATKLSESILEWQAARAQGEPSSGVTDLSARINRVSRRSLDGSVVMSGEEWNGIVELVEKLITVTQQGGVPEETINAVISLVKDAAAAHLSSEFNSYLNKIRKLITAAPAAPAVQGGGVPEIVATFECESNGVTGSTTAPIKRIELHDDGTIEVILDYWSTSPYSGERVRCDDRQTDAINHALDVLSKHGDAFTSIGAMLVLEEMLEPQPPKAKEASHDNQ